MHTTLEAIVEFSFASATGKHLCLDHEFVCA
jgi:hypothetical protein